MNIALKALHGQPIRCRTSLRTDYTNNVFDATEKGAGGSGPATKLSASKSCLIKDLASQVLRSFNTWSFKRQQPDNVDGMLQRIESAIAVRAPIDFCLYWGKGPRHCIASADIQCLEFLNRMADRIRQVYELGAVFTLIFTDTHAELNGHGRTAIDRYFADIAAAGRERGFASCFLSDLVAIAQAEGCRAAPTPLHLVEKLIVTAEKWYQGGGSIELGALRYLELNMMEKRAVEHSFPTSTFITFNGGEMRELFPESMPIFFMYSVRRGVSVKPWFINESASSNGDSESMPHSNAVAEASL